MLFKVDYAFILPLKFNIKLSVKVSWEFQAPNSSLLFFKWLVFIWWMCPHTNVKRCKSMWKVDILYFCFSVSFFFFFLYKYNLISGCSLNFLKKHYFYWLFSPQWSWNFKGIYFHFDNSYGLGRKLIKGLFWFLFSKLMNRIQSPQYS